MEIKQMNHIRTVDVCGDMIEITQNGSAWVSPSNGQQHSRATVAMRAELEIYFSACGEDASDQSIIEEIDDLISKMD